MSETAVSSFVIRFKQDQTSDPPALPWRGLIRHVQTSQEIHFTQIEDALEFMAQFVEIDEKRSDYPSPIKKT
jgi:hypothetical protein